MCKALKKHFAYLVVCEAYKKLEDSQLRKRSKAKTMVYTLIALDTADKSLSYEWKWTEGKTLDNSIQRRFLIQQKCV